MTENTMRLVVVESPYMGDTATNVAYAQACLHDCIHRGEAPFASHLLYTQPGVLDDNIPEERTLGIRAGFEWGRKADAVIVYTDRGMSNGMRAGIAAAQSRGTPIEYRTLPGWGTTPTN